MRVELNLVGFTLFIYHITYNKQYFTMKLSTKFYALSLCVSLTLFSSCSKQVSIFIVGDSTAANKSHPETNPERGWGMAFQGFFDSKVKVDNHAVNGRSSKSFINEGRWTKVLEKVKRGDYVIIQFGHNDEKTKPDRYTIPGSTFDEYLSQYVDETRQRGGIPILMNSVVRRNFFKKPVQDVDDESLRNTEYTDEEINSDTLVDTHGAYLLSPRNVALNKGVVFIDANKITHDLEQCLGIVGSRRLHMWFKPGEIESIPKGRHDNTHYNIYGAHQVASLLADALGDKVPALKRHIRHYDYVLSKRGFGNYMSLQKLVDEAPAETTTKVYVLDGKWKLSNVDMKGKKIKFDLYPGATLDK